MTSDAVANGMLTPWRWMAADMAGTSAMNGEASRATTAMSSMAARQPGSAMAARAPMTIRGTIPRPRPALIGFGSLTRANATTTAAKDAALMPNTTA